MCSVKRRGPPYCPTNLKCVNKVAHKLTETNKKPNLFCSFSGQNEHYLAIKLLNPLTTQKQHIMFGLMGQKAVQSCDPVNRIRSSHPAIFC